jgi:ceramide glucosyltransferase
MPTFAIAIKLLLAGSILAAIAYYVVSIFAAFHFFSEPEDHQSCDLLPVTVIIPLCGVDAGAYENYASFCRQDYPEYQIVFGVRDPHDPSVPIVRKLITDFPGRDIELLISRETIGENLKVSNLQNMLGRARHELLVIADSDIRVGSDYLRSIVPPLLGEQVGLVTCPYRAAKAENPAAVLEAIGITAEFQPGVLVARVLGGIRFAMGATMAITKAKLQSIGGFQAIADYLADDFQLGNLISEAGYEVHLSHYVVQTVLEPAGFFGMIKHQIRWARGIRVCRPMGYLGLVLTYGTVLALLGVIADHGSGRSVLLLSLTVAVRLLMAWIIGVHWLGDGILRKHIWLIPVRDVLSFLIWCLSLAGTRVEWRGGVFQIGHGGKIMPAR